MSPMEPPEGVGGAQRQKSSASVNEEVWIWGGKRGGEGCLPLIQSVWQDDVCEEVVPQLLLPD